MNLERSQGPAVVEAIRLAAERPTARDTHRLRCRACPGAAAFASADPRATCPTCGGETGPAATTRPAPPIHLTFVPPDLSTDAAIAKLQDRERALPGEIGGLETRLAGLRARREAAERTYAELRVKASVGLAEMRDVNAAMRTMADLDNEITEVEASLDGLSAGARVLAETIVERLRARRAAAVPEAKAAARKLAADLRPHLDAIEQLAARAAVDAARFEQVLGRDEHTGARNYGDAGEAMGLLQFFARFPRRKLTPLGVLAACRELISRL